MSDNKTELVPVSSATAIANSPHELSGMQAPILAWAEEKLSTVKAELADLTQACDDAKTRKWKVSALARAVGNAATRVDFYEKVVEALRAGYMLFPPVPNADCIAIRCQDAAPPERYKSQQSNWSAPRGAVEQFEPLPSHEGQWLSPVLHWKLLRYFKDAQGVQQKEWFGLDLAKPEFPLIMAKPQIIQATTAAMEMKIFDEIRLFPFERRQGDPCILGTIVDQRNRRKHYFLISWLVRKEDI